MLNGLQPEERYRLGRFLFLSGVSLAVLSVILAELSIVSGVVIGTMAVGYCCIGIGARLISVPGGLSERPT